MTRNRNSGRCLCGAVSYHLDDELQPVLHCHCGNCRRISGNFVAAARAETAQLVVSDPDDRLRWYELEYARYAFCEACGSTLFYRAADRPQFTTVMVGTLDDAANLPLKAVWFAAEAQPHNALPPDVPHFDGNG